MPVTKTVNVDDDWCIINIDHKKLGVMFQVRVIRQKEEDKTPGDWLIEIYDEMNCGEQIYVNEIPGE